MHKNLDEFEFLPDPTSDRSYLPLSAKINILSCGHSSAFIFEQIFFILSGIEDNHKVWTEFEFWVDRT